ncbi:2-oxoisovalerate dehydrogenase subunit beta, mitochondrial [Wickerhamiella sorbophila]|uniref:3-methyl-2-oxobutanoate dehydrogenase (2-methylpropanoyl-transferring) n=1 Tax=Wickerhamiella sorbophila TaxID=45607 RepID=A0A2T0FM43_9ASCO|nr:2-oxoisovalerate dehydrogenase subunit beta, mitochondrial [Wickerhamiella sorbophila]PRT56050.1 2-oxoisovalerate dehydrogenase subunit beta, mitochondrial [Wickerhamiella sorbophila]
MLRLSRQIARYSTQSGLNAVKFNEAPFLANTVAKALDNPELPPSVRESSVRQMNLYEAINDGLRIAMETDESAVLFGEDVVFGGVFRCSKGLQEKFGSDRVFNSPLNEQAIVGFAIGYAAMNKTAIAEIQFADYVFPAFDQLVNEAAKMRYRSGSQFTSGGLTVRMPCGAVGHGGLYHSQSGEAFFSHAPGLRVVVPRSPIQAKGLLLSSIRCQDPTLFLEPKILYRASIEQVPLGDFNLPLDKAEIIRPGTDVTIVSYGTPLYQIMKAAQLAKEQMGISCEVIDLRTVVPWDRETVINSIKKTGRCIAVHEAPRTGGIGSEIAAEVQRLAFLHLEAPVLRIAHWDTPNSLSFEGFQIPDVARILDGIKATVKF